MTERKLEELAIPLPVSGHKPDFAAPIEITLDNLHAVHLYFSWGQQTVGFGQCDVLLTNGKLTADTENMSREWLRRALHALADTLADKAELT